MNLLDIYNILTMEIFDFSISFLLELILEGLPISSSGHLQFFSYFSSFIEPLSYFNTHFSHCLIGGIQIFYLWHFFKILFLRKKFSSIFFILIHFISITILTGLGYIIKKNISFIDVSFPLPYGFLISTLFLLFIFFMNNTISKRYYSLSFRDSIFLGIWQCIAFLPGVSRLATMLLGAHICGFTRKHALFIAVMSNVCISGLSGIYLIYYNFFVDSISIVVNSVLILKIIIGLLLSAVVFFSFINLFNKNKIIGFFYYELLVFFISYFLL